MPTANSASLDRVVESPRVEGLKDKLVATQTDFKLVNIFISPSCHLRNADKRQINTHEYYKSVPTYLRVSVVYST